MSAERTAGELERLRAAYAAMAAIRAFEETVAAAHADGVLPGLLHLSIGGEAVAVGVLSVLADGDRVYSSHRPHGHFLAAGVEPRALFAELAGREAGLNRGRAGSMHLSGERAVLATGVVGGTLPIAVGHALRLPARALCAVFFGDGAVQTGVFHESLNLAALWRVPVLFVCENNGWAEFSAREDHTTVAEVVRHAGVYGIDGRVVDGSDVEAVSRAAGELVSPLRDGGGPALLECRFSRLVAHYEGGVIQARGEGADPLARAEELLRELGADVEELADGRRTAAAEARAALADALAGAPARPTDDASLVFAAPLPCGRRR